MDRRRFLLTSFAASAAAQPSRAIGLQRQFPRVGIMAIVSGPTPRTRALADRLGELGYHDGQNIALDWKWAAGNAGRFGALAQDLAGSSDVIVAAGPNAIVAAAKATRTIPIVMVAGPDPVRLGLAKTYPRPGGNVTGNIWAVTPDVFGKQVELLKQSAPRLSRLTVLTNPEGPGVAEWVRAVEVAATRLQVQSQIVDVRGENDVPLAVASAKQDGAGALLVIPDLVTYALRGSIIKSAARERVPTMYSFGEMVEEGGFIAYGPSLGALYRQAATYVDKILKGAKAADLPIEQPTRFDLAINLKSAGELGLMVPPPLLLQAESVIH